MRLLLDSHTLLWWLIDDPRLSSRARETIQQPKASVFVSAASVWEDRDQDSEGQAQPAAGY